MIKEAARTLIGQSAAIRMIKGPGGSRHGRGAPMGASTGCQADCCYASSLDLRALRAWKKPRPTNRARRSPAKPAPMPAHSVIWPTVHQPYAFSRIALRVSPLNRVSALAWSSAASSSGMPSARAAAEVSA